MNNSRFIISTLIFVLISSISPAQESLTGGSNRELKVQTAEFGKINCEVTPLINYYAEKPGHLEINFKAKWFDKKHEKLDDTKNLLFLIDDFDKLENKYDQKGISIFHEGRGISLKNKPINSIGIFLNGKKIPHKHFIDGFLAFNVMTASPLIIEDNDLTNALLEIKFDFIYVAVVGDKRYIRNFVKEPVSWKILIPDLSKQNEICRELKDKYDKKMAVLITSYDKENSVRLKNEIESEKDIEQCSNLKETLLENINVYIQQGEQQLQQQQETLAKELAEKKEKEKSTTETKKITKQKKAINWAKKELDYKNLIKNLDIEFIDLKNNTENDIADISESLGTNSIEISYLKNILQSFEKLSLDSLDIVKLRLANIKVVNSDNIDWIENILENLRSFRSKVNKNDAYCKSDFLKLDKTEGSKRYEKFHDQFIVIIENINELEALSEQKQDNINLNNKSILKLMGRIEPGIEIIITNLIAKYDSLFGIIINEITRLEDDFISLRKEFEENRIKWWYFKSNKKKYLGKSENIFDDILELETKDSLIEVEKSGELTQYDFDADFEKKQDFEKKLIDLKPGVQYLSSEITEWPTQKFPYLYLFLFLIITSILIFGARVYLKALKVKTIKVTTSKSTIASVNIEDKPTKGGITITQTVNSQVKGKGLLEVRQKAGIDFLELDLSQEWDNSMVKKIYFERNCIINTYRFFEDSVSAVDTDTTANETGGYLIGRWDSNPDDPDKFDISLEEFVEPGDDASFSKYKLNFGAKIGVKLQKAIENRKTKDNKEVVKTAWFHSHPGLKIFLSDYDLSVQKDFSGNDKKLRMVALVIDPYTEKWDTGIFTYKSDESMNNAEDSKQFFSLDEMYKWALGPVETGHENFFSIHLSKFYSDTIIKTVFFSNPCILEIKRSIEDNMANLNLDDIIVFLTGYKQNDRTANSNIIFEKTNRPEENSLPQKPGCTEIKACIVKTSDKIQNINDLLLSEKIINENAEIILAYNYDENSIIIVSKNNKGTFNEIPENIEKINFTDMISWTRKRK